MMGSGTTRGDCRYGIIAMEGCKEGGEKDRCEGLVESR